MDDKDVKTSPKQRFFIILIAVLMVGSIVASYAAIVISGATGAESSVDSEIDQEKVAQLQEDYQKKVTEFSEATKGDFDKFVKYKSEVKAYNETAANEGGVAVKDLKEGSGAAVTEDNYYAYYIGWCADESVFDSTFDNDDNPTAFVKVLDPSVGLIEGWYTGVEGMKIGGVREITVPGELAYKDTQEICGGKNKPLKFAIMAVAKAEPLTTLADELETAAMRLQYYAQYGIDYDNLVNTQQ